MAVFFTIAVFVVEFFRSDDDFCSSFENPEKGKREEVNVLYLNDVLNKSCS